MKGRIPTALAAVAVTALLAFPSTASSFFWDGMYWPSGSMGTAINSQFPSKALSAVKRSASTWNNAGSSFTFYYTGKTSATASTSAPDYVNVLCHANNGDTGALALTYAWYTVSTGALIDVDVEVNSFYPWAGGRSPNHYDLESVITHELGHALGLLDLYGGGDTEKTMYGYVAKGEVKKRTLDPDDINGVRTIYP